MAKKKLEKFLPWIEARRRFHLSDALERFIGRMEADLQGAGSAGGGRT